MDPRSYTERLEVTRRKEGRDGGDQGRNRHGVDGDIRRNV